MTERRGEIVILSAEQLSAMLHLGDDELVTDVRRMFGGGAFEVFISGPTRTPIPDGGEAPRLGYDPSRKTV
jgi:hypothetical protein